MRNFMLTAAVLQFHQAHADLTTIVGLSRGEILDIQQDCYFWEDQINDIDSERAFARRIPSIWQ